MIVNDIYVPSTFACSTAFSWRNFSVAICNVTAIHNGISWKIERNSKKIKLE